MTIPSDIIKTIGDEDEIEYFSEESDVEVEFQPTKQKNKSKVDFDTAFTFATTAEEYSKDVWNDLAKYVKRKAKTKTDDKIKKARRDLQNSNEDQVNADLKAEDQLDIALSDDELKYDSIKVKEKKKTKKKQEDEEFFEEGTIVGTEVAGSFYEMNLSRPLMKAIGEMKFVHPTPIQASTIPVALLGRDICGCAATGTGKTAAYMLPTLERLLFRPADSAITRVLVLVPTRELGVQVYQVSKQLTQFTDIQIGLAVGGLDLKIQENILRKNPDVVIATPGRLIDHLKSTPSFSLDSIEVLILDEADRMLDEYFAEQMKEIIKQCNRNRQTMLFSATMSEEVNDLVAVSLNKPVKLFANSNREVAFNLRQEFVRIRQDHEGDREAILSALVCRTFRHHCIVFVQTKKQAHRLHIMLGLFGVRVVELHGNLTQPQRLEALEKFKNEEADVLVATDVAARGLDISGVQTVINFVMPASLEHYIHRVGRTARAGRAGVSVSLAGESERRIVKEIIKRAANPVKSRIIPADIVDKYKGKLENMEGKINEILREEYEERMLAKAENQANRAEKLLKGEVDGKRPWFQTKIQRKEEQERLALVPKTISKSNGVHNEKNKSKNQGKKRKHGDSHEDNDDNDDKKQNTKQKNAKSSKNNKKELGKDAHVKDELTKVALLQAKIAKRQGKPKKMNVCLDNSDVGAKSGRKKGKRSNFDVELTDTSAKGAKKLRYNAQLAMKSKNLGKNKNKNKGQGGPVGKGRQGGRGGQGGAGAGAAKGNKKSHVHNKAKGKAFGKPRSKQSKF